MMKFFAPENKENKKEMLAATTLRSASHHLHGKERGERHFSHTFFKANLKAGEQL